MMGNEQDYEQDYPVLEVAEEPFAVYNGVLWLKRRVP